MHRVSNLVHGVVWSQQHGLLFPDALKVEGLLASVSHGVLCADPELEPVRRGDEAVGSQTVNSCIQPRNLLINPDFQAGLGGCSVGVGSQDVKDVLHTGAYAAALGNGLDDEMTLGDGQRKAGLLRMLCLIGDRCLEVEAPSAALEFCADDVVG